MLKDYAGRIPQDPPNQDQVEVVLFGPGFGESILVHLGVNEWIIIDSCMPSGAELPAPIWYLRSIGVDPATAVKLIVATHWHDDHIRGMAQVVEECHEATFCTSSVLGDTEFLAMAIGYEERNMVPFPSGAEEILKVYKTLNGRPIPRPPIKYAVPGLALHRLPSSRSGFSGDCEVFSLSPSDEDINDFRADVAQRRTDQIGEKGVAPKIVRNDGAIVIRIQINNHAILLGSDLENGNDPLKGWKAVLNFNQWPGLEAGIFKIPHHGSPGADSVDVWRTMVADNSLSILTPWNRGRKLPQESDVARIYSNTPFAMTTSVFSLPARKKHGPEVEKNFRSHGRAPKKVNPRMGAIRLRNKGYDLSKDWNVEFFGPATQLEYVHV